MSTAVADAELVRRVVLHDVSWTAYQTIRQGSTKGRFTYDQGDLEIMSPSWRLERKKSRLARLVEVFTEERDIPLRAVGSTTLDREDLSRGMEADEGFYVGDMAAPSDWDDLDLTVDPPPNLLMEIEETQSAMDKLSICAALGIQEV